MDTLLEDLEVARRGVEQVGELLIAGLFAGLGLVLEQGRDLVVNVAGVDVVESAGQFTFFEFALEGREVVGFGFADFFGNRIWFDADGIDDAIKGSFGRRNR